jgi:hypothetical protein
MLATSPNSTIQSKAAVQMMAWPPCWAQSPPGPNQVHINCQVHVQACTVAWPHP